MTVTGVDGRVMVTVVSKAVAPGVVTVRVVVVSVTLVVVVTWPVVLVQAVAKLE